MRKLHRWISPFAALFLLSVAVTGTILQFQKLFGGEEAEREKLAAAVSAYTLASPLPDLPAALARAQAAVRQKLGGADAPLDGVDVRLKGEHPSLLLRTAGKERWNFTVNIATGRIEAQTREEGESFIRRLHSGEIFGDAGVVLGILWGLALIVLTVTGAVLYWQIWRTRRRARGAAAKAALGASLLAAILPLAIPAIPAARAGSPFLTDDPGFAPKGQWELKGVAAYEHSIGGDILTAPVPDINHSFFDHFKLNLTLAERSVFPRGGKSATGFADTDFKFKPRFVDEPGHDWWPAVSMAPDVTFPTAPVSNGLGDGFYRFRIPFQVGKTFGKTYVYAEGGYQFAFAGRSRDQAIYGAAAQYQLTENLNVGAEINGNSTFATGNRFALLANLGAACNLRPGVQLQGSVGRTLRDPGLGGPEVLAQLFLQWGF